MRSIKVSRRTFGAVAVRCAAAIALPAWCADARPERSRLVIAAGGKSSFYFLPLTIAEQLGYFRSEGLDVEISDHANGARALMAAMSGAADLVSGAYEHTIRQQSRNLSFQSLVLHGRAPQMAMGVSSRTLPGYRSLADLKGKRIGVTAIGSSTHLMAGVVLGRSGLSMADVLFVGVGSSTAAVTALRNGQVDVMCNVEPVMTMLEQKSEVRIVHDTRTLKGTQEVFGGPMPAGCLYASSDFVQKNPGTCQALANAVVHSLKWLQTAGPSDMIKTVPESYLLGDRAMYLAAFNKIREAIAIDGLMPEEGPRTALRALAGFEPEVRADRIQLARTYTNEFARKAKDRFKA